MRLILLIVFGLPLGILAQKPPITLKTNPLEWINPFKQTFSLHTDLPFKDNFGLELGLGYVFDAPSFASDKGESYRGPRARASLKTYFNKTEASNSYVALTAKGSMVKHAFFDPVLRQGGQYEELLYRKRSVNMVALGIMVGSQEFIGAQKRVFIEPYVGLGVRWTEVNLSALTPDAESLDEREWGIGLTEPGTHFTPDIIFGIHVGISLAK